MTLALPAAQAASSIGTTVIAGVDTHSRVHHASVLASDGRHLGGREFPASEAGYQDLLEWVGSFGVIDRIGVELAGAYGAGLAAHLLAAGVEVVDVDIAHRQVRARRGKDDRIDSLEAARKTLSGQAATRPKDRSGVIESLRQLRVVRESAVCARTVALQNLRDLTVTAPARLREQLPDADRQRVRVEPCARLRPDTTRMHEPEQAAKHSLRMLARRVRFLDEEIADLDKHMRRLVEAACPALIEHTGIGTQVAAQMLITWGHPGRVPTAAKFARLTGCAPIPASSGKTHRHRLHRGGDRQANRAIHTAVINRIRHDPETRAYYQRRTEQGLSKRDTIRCLKTHLARRIWRTLERT